jgi:glycosyltransferase involved in cell wall biosynthesis
MDACVPARNEKIMNPPVSVSVIICSHNPRAAYLARTLASLEAQTLQRSEWELLLVDNNSQELLADRWCLSWHPHARHIREEEPGLTPARIRGIAESHGDLLIFVDDDNVLVADYLESAKVLHQRSPWLGAFGSGALVPEFEAQPPHQIRPRLSMLALREISNPQWADRHTATDCIPWGAGLCVIRRVASTYRDWVTRLRMSSLDRTGERLYGGGDDLFSFVACEQGLSFGIFPELRITHLIGSRRLSEDYIVRLIHDHAYSHAILRYLVFGEPTRAGRRLDGVRMLLHGLRRGSFSRRCRAAELKGLADASRQICTEGLQPVFNAHWLTRRPSCNTSVGLS